MNQKLYSTLVRSLQNRQQSVNGPERCRRNNNFKNQNTGKKKRDHKPSLVSTSAPQPVRGIMRDTGRSESRRENCKSHLHVKGKNNEAETLSSRQQKPGSHFPLQSKGKQGARVVLDGCWDNETDGLTAPCPRNSVMSKLTPGHKPDREVLESLEGCVIIGTLAKHDNRLAGFKKPSLLDSWAWRFVPRNRFFNLLFCSGWATKGHLSKNQDS